MIRYEYYVSYLIRDGNLMTKTIGEGDARDFDETRRLLYMTLAAPHTKKYNLVGTLVNALKHHHGHPGSADEIIAQLIHVIEGGEDETFVREQIDRITAELCD